MWNFASLARAKAAREKEEQDFQLLLEGIEVAVNAKQHGLTEDKVQASTEMDVVGEYFDQSMASLKGAEEIEKQLVSLTQKCKSC